MALSDLWTQAQLVTAARRELMDPTGTLSWSWTDLELQMYVSDWQTILQDKFEFTWGSATTAVASNTNTYGPYEFPLTNVATNMLRPGNMWYATQNGTGTPNWFRLVGRTKEEIEIMERDWREVGTGVPQVAYMSDVNTIGIWPPPSVNGTLLSEYPKQIIFAATTSTMQTPAWTRYSYLDYVCWRALERPGPNQNLIKSSRCKARLVAKLKRYKTIWENYLPDKAPSFRIGGTYEGDILNIGRYNTLFQTWM
jgi:hypothetical protein